MMNFMKMTHRFSGRVRNRAPVLLFLLVLLSFLFVSHNPFANERIWSGGLCKPLNVAGEGRRYTTGPLADGSKVFQSFVPHVGLRHIDIQFDTMRRTNKSVVRISLFEDAKTPGDVEGLTPLASSTQDSSQWDPNPQIPLDLDGKSLEPGRTYAVLIESSGGGEDDSPSVFRVRLRDPSAGNVFLDGRVISGSLCLQGGKVVNVPAVVLLSLTLSVLVAGAVVFFLFAGASPLRDFLLFSACIGWLYAFASPFPNPLDEEGHHYKANCVSRMMPLESWRGDLLGNELPGDFQPSFTLRNASTRAFYARGSDGTGTKFHKYPFLSHTIPVGHAVLAVPLALCRLLSVPVMPSILLGRLFNYLIYVLICAAAIRFAKAYAPFFAAVSLLPMEQWLAGSFSTDPLICGGAFLFAGIVCGTRQGDGSSPTAVGWREFALLVACTLLFSSPKYCGYAPVALLAFAIPKGSFGSSRMRTGLLLSVFAVILALAAAQTWLFSEFPYHETRNGDTDVSRQFAFVLAHPASFAKSVVSWIVDDLPGCIGAGPPASLVVCRALPAGLSYTILLMRWYFFFFTTFFCWMS